MEPYGTPMVAGAAGSINFRVGSSFTARKHFVAALVSAGRLDRKSRNLYTPSVFNAPVGVPVRISESSLVPRKLEWLGYLKEVWWYIVWLKMHLWHEMREAGSTDIQSTTTWRHRRHATECVANRAVLSIRVYSKMLPLLSSAQTVHINLISCNINRLLYVLCFFTLFLVLRVVRTVHQQ